MLVLCPKGSGEARYFLFFGGDVAVFVELIAQGSDADAEDGGGFGAILVMDIEGFKDEPLFEFVKGDADGEGFFF